MRHFLDIHAAFGGDDHGDAARCAVDQHGEVVFGGDVHAIGDIEAVDLLAGFAGLHRHQRIAEHLAGIGCNVLDALGQPHAALGVGTQLLELALAAPAGMDLRLHHIQRSGQLPGAFDRFLHAHRRIAGGYANAEFREQFLGLVFVDVHFGEEPLVRGIVAMQRSISTIASGLQTLPPATSFNPA